MIQNLIKLLEFRLKLQLTRSANDLQNVCYNFCVVFTSSDAFTLVLQRRLFDTNYFHLVRKFMNGDRESFPFFAVGATANISEQNMERTLMYETMPFTVNFNRTLWRLFFEKDR